MTKNNYDFFGFDKLNYVSNNLLSILFNEAKEIPIAFILDKICVSPPYFAFKKMYKYQNILIAQVRTEQPTGNEITSMSIGEAGRHMAILGTCVCAIDQGNKNYYLVKNAKTKLILKDIDSFCNNDDLYIAIESRYIDGRIANAYGILFNTEKKVIYQIEASYNKVKVATFAKFFKKYNSESFSIKESPYKKQIFFKNKKINNDKLVISFPEIEKERCAGHFNNYPILPTAFIIYNIIAHIGNFLLKKNNKKRYYISEVVLDLLEMLFLNSKKEAEILYKKNNNNNSYEVYCNIIQDKKKNADIFFSIYLI
jgi:hypothetical protein